MKSFIKTFLYCLGFTVIAYSGQISWEKSVPIGICLGLFFNVLDDIKNK